MVADRIGIFEDGSLLALGNMDELRASLKYQYSVRVSSGNDLPEIEGRVLKGRDGRVQMITTREEAVRLSERFIGKDVRFSINPVTLDDIFYHIAGEDIDHDEQGGQEQ